MNLIPKAYLKKLFNSFYDSSTKSLEGNLKTMDIFWLFTT